jgi:hypothetical protein
MKSRLARRGLTNAPSLANAQLEFSGFRIDARLTCGYKGSVGGFSPESLLISTVPLFAPMRQTRVKNASMPAFDGDPIGQHRRQLHTRFSLM